MIRSTVLALFLGLITTVSFSQITLGPRGGANFNGQNTGSEFEVMKFGWMFGGAINVPVGESISIQPEFLYTQKGYRLEFNGNDAYDELTANYFEVPLQVLYTKRITRWHPFGGLGLFGAYWASGKYESKLSGQDTILEDYEFTDEYDSDGYRDNRIDYGFVISAGVMYDRVGVAGNIVLDIRYTRGFATINEVLEEPSNYSARVNSTFTIALAYMFSL